MKLILLVGLALFLIVSLDSCFTSRPQSYFNGMLDTSRIESFKIPDPIIQRNDQLGIMIYSDNPEATTIFNQAGRPLTPIGGQQGLTTSVTNQSQSGPQYIVDNEGNLRLHEIGILHAEGLTKKELEDLITQKLIDRGVLQNPYCVIRFTNFKITVLGEVKNPGVYTLPVEKATILEALGMAGDVGDYGRKENVMLIRENLGKRTYSFVNLLDTTTFNTSSFYLAQNDVLLVQPDRRKQTAADRETLLYITAAATVISTIALIINLVK